MSQKTENERKKRTSGRKDCQPKKKPEQVKATVTSSKVMLKEDAEQFRRFEEQFEKIDKGIVAASLQQHGLIAQRQQIAAQHRDWWLMMVDKYRLNTWSAYKLTVDNEIVVVEERPEQSLVEPRKQTLSKEEIKEENLSMEKGIGNA